ncbi:hypothetical protein MLD38_023826 [Melastoma candidum]|uniref:Uncharacterized protein n=1 Tax=Melastoma candidum TaxID=119954 RepID=A0ACB9NQT5_9MYRT|nr:hypothetical protein MLD38_023826 [Melastoma candidum]
MSFPNAPQCLQLCWAHTPRQSVLPSDCQGGHFQNQRQPRPCDSSPPVLPGGLPRSDGNSDGQPHPWCSISLSPVSIGSTTASANLLATNRGEPTFSFGHLNSGGTSAEAILEALPQPRSNNGEYPPASPDMVVTNLSPNHGGLPHSSGVHGLPVLTATHALHGRQTSSGYGGHLDLTSKPNHGNSSPLRFLRTHGGANPCPDPRGRPKPCQEMLIPDHGDPATATKTR